MLITVLLARKYLSEISEAQKLSDIFGDLQVIGVKYLISIKVMKMIV